MLIFLYKVMQNTLHTNHVIQMQDAEGPLLFPFSVVEAYHGHTALAMLAITYQGLYGALTHLDTHGEPIYRQDITIVSGHPGPGVRDAFECVTRAMTRGKYVVDLTLPDARYSQHKDKSYSFILTYKDQSVRAVLKPNVLPERFFELLGAADAASQQEHRQLRRQIAENVLQQTANDLFDYTVLS